MNQLNNVAINDEISLRIKTDKHKNIRNLCCGNVTPFNGAIVMLLPFNGADTAVTTF